MKMAPSGEEELSKPDFSLPVQDIGERNNPVQFVNSNCYGKVLRLSDIKLPPVPQSFISLTKNNSRSANAASILKGTQGRRLENRQPKPKNDLENFFDDKKLPDHEQVEQEETKDDVKSIDKEESCQSTSPMSPLRLQWSMLPPNVCQIDGLPISFDQEVIEDVICFYSTIIEKEEREHNGQLSIRYRLSNSDACQLLSSSMNDSDLFGTGQKIRCTHIAS